MSSSLFILKYHFFGDKLQTCPDDILQPLKSDYQKIKIFNSL